MKDKPLISVVLPTYNGSEFISQSINSIINQTYTNWELIIVNDCSTDNTAEIIQTFAQKDSRIRVLTNEVNKKLPASLNVGFKQAQGEYYTWTSDDNEYYPQAFEKMVDFLQNNDDYGMVYAQTNVEENGVLQNYLWCTEKTTPELLLQISVPGACFLYKADVAKLVGEYDVSIFLNEDHDYWLRLFLVSKIGNLNETLYLYRLRKNNLTNLRQNDIQKGKLALLRKYRKIYAKHFEGINEYFKHEICVDNFVEGQISFEEVRKTVPKEILYKLLKKEVILTKNFELISKIKSLGFIYFLKAVKLKYKYGVEK